MKIAIRILGLATIVLWIITIFFIVTAVYSVTQLGLEIGATQMLPSSDGINFSIPFSIANNGYYEITDFNLTTRITDPNGTMLDQSYTLIPSIPKGTTKNATHTILINVDTIMSVDAVYLLLNDSSFELEVFLALNFARAIPIHISTNRTILWGAPLSQFSVGRPTISSFNGTHREATIPVNFENHAVLDLTGTLKLEFYSDSQEMVASGETAINVPSGESYNGEISAYPREQDILKLSSTENVHVILETPMFIVEWEESYG